MIDELHYWTIAEAARNLKTGTLSPVTLVETLLDRIEVLNPQLDAFVTLTGAQALDVARQAEADILAGRYRGPLHGIPFGLKDIFDAAGTPTTGHSRIAMENLPECDATTTARLIAAGGILMGKLSTHEFAHGGPSFDLPWPPARNPWNREHFTGGSSSGSGAAVAAGFVLGALGSDTGGSIRNPAALCGIVGLKPTYGLVSRYGVIPNSYTFDHCGPMTWTVEDCAIMLQVIAGYDPSDPASADVMIPDYRSELTGDIRDLRIGVVRNFWEADLPANVEVQAAMNTSIDVLRGLGTTCADVRMASMQEYYDVKVVIAESELFSGHREALTDHPGEFGTDFLARSLPACLFTGADYVEAQRRRRLLLAAMPPIYKSHDVLITAGPYGPAPRLDAHNFIDFWRKPNIVTPFNVTGGPALSLCNGISDSGLPRAMQVGGRPFDEPTVLRVADAYEKATTWRGRRPVIEAGTNAKQPAPHTPAPPEVTLDAATQVLVAGIARRTGLKLDETQLAHLYRAAPEAFAMANRLRQPLAWSNEPANTFRFPTNG